MGHVELARRIVLVPCQEVRDLHQNRVVAVDRRGPPAGAFGRNPDGFGLASATPFFRWDGGILRPFRLGVGHLLGIASVGLTCRRFGLVPLVHLSGKEGRGEGLTGTCMRDAFSVTPRHVW